MKYSIKPDLDRISHIWKQHHSNCHCGSWISMCAVSFLCCCFLCHSHISPSMVTLKWAHELRTIHTFCATHLYTEQGRPDHNGNPDHWIWIWTTTEAKMINTDIRIISSLTGMEFCLTLFSSYQTKLWQNSQAPNIFWLQWCDKP